MKLKISQIRTDGGTQPRAELNQQTIEEYAEAIREGAVFPAVDVFYDGTDYWLGDGFHRVGGHKLAGKEEIEATIHQGSRRDAKWFSFGANKAHGLRRVPGDTRRAIETILKDEEWSKVPQTKIAEHVGVSQQYVSQINIQLTITCKLPDRTTVDCKDGKTRNVSNIGKTPPTGKPAEESTYTKEVIDIEIPLDDEEITTNRTYQEIKTSTEKEDIEEDGVRESHHFKRMDDTAIVISIMEVVQRKMRYMSSFEKKTSVIKALIEELNLFIGQSRSEDNGKTD